MSSSILTRSSLSHRAVGLVVAVLALVAATLQVVSGGTAYAVDDASISGTVLLPNGMPALGVCVSADDGDEIELGSDETVANGTYSITGLPAGVVKVQFSPCEDQNLLTEWYDDKPTFDTATPITLTASQARTGVNATLAAGGVVSGTVTVPTGVADEICITAYDADQDFVGSTYVDTTDNGAYSIQALPAGPIRVKFRDCSGTGKYVTEWYDDKPTFDTANPIQVVIGTPATGKNAALALAAHVTGTVTGPGGTALSNICVEASGTGGDDPNDGFDTTDAQGKYDIGGLGTASVVVHFFDCSVGTTATNFAGEYYDDKPTYAQANPVTTTAGLVTSNINAQLAAGGSIAGTVKGPDGAGVSVCVEALDSVTGNGVGFATSLANGTYRIDRLPAGQVKVDFYDCTGGDLLPEYYNDKATFAAAESIAVVAGQTSGPIDAQLAAGGRVTGTVTGPSGAPAPDVCITVENLAGTEVAYGDTETDGTYVAHAVPPGPVKVLFEPCDNQPLHLEWWNDQLTFATATQLTVVVGQATSGINAQLTAAGPTPPGPTPTPPPAPVPPKSQSAACLAATSTFTTVTASVTAAQAKVTSASKKYKKVKKASGAASAKAKKAKKSVAKAKAALKAAQSAAAAALATKTASC